MRFQKCDALLQAGFLVTVTHFIVAVATDVVFAPCAMSITATIGLTRDVICIILGIIVTHSAVQPGEVLSTQPREIRKRGSIVYYCQRIDSGCAASGRGTRWVEAWATQSRLGGEGHSGINYFWLPLHANERVEEIAVEN